MAEIKTQRLDGYLRLFDIARDLASTLDLDDLLNRIITAAANITGAEAASILLYDEAARQLHFQVATNLDEPIMRGLSVPLEGSIAGWIVLNRKPVHVADAQRDPRHFTLIEETTGFVTRSLLGVPLITKNKVVGVLEVLNKEEGAFSDADESLLSVLGAQAAIAIENTRLFQQFDLISEFVHELRTPLASLSTATYLLLRPEISREQHDQIVNSIRKETLRLNALASAFLDLARLESGRVQYHKTRFDLADLLHECRDVMASKASEEGVQMKIEAPDDLPLLEADRDKMKQVLLNLISNGIKYNRRRGAVTIRAAATESEVHIAVQDTGVGIPEEALPRLFEKFFRVRETEGIASGSGLGLSICKQIVQGHGGRIEVKSKMGGGSLFTVCLPRGTRPPAKEPLPEQTSRPQ